MKKSSLLVSIVAVILCLALISCSPTEESAIEGKEDSKETDLVEEEGSSKDGKKTKITVWGINTLGIGSGNEEMIDAFNETHADIELVAQSTPNAPGYETQDLTKLTAAIAAGNAPDISVLNAPFIMEVAARGVLEPLDDLIKNTQFNFNQFYEYTIDEMTFDGKIWGIPNGVDTRFLYYNKRLFKEAGLDPENPPKTWEQLLETAEKLTKESEDGDLTQIGFIPNYGNSWLYLYLIQNGGRMVSEDGRVCTMNMLENVEALEFMVEGYDLMGGAEKINSYVTSFADQTGANDPLLTGEVAMVINGDWAIGTYARYGKDVIEDIGYTYAPTPTGDDFVTWSGGWSYGIPKGTKNPEAAFKAASWLATQGVIEQSKGISAYNLKEGYLDIPVFCASKSINEELYQIYVEPMESEHVKGMIQFGIDLLDISYPLPVHPVGQFIWSEHARAIDNAIYKKMTSQEALDEATSNVQKEIDDFYKSYIPSE